MSSACRTKAHQRSKHILLARASTSPAGIARNAHRPSSGISTPPEAPEQHHLGSLRVAPAEAVLLQSAAEAPLAECS